MDYTAILKLIETRFNSPPLTQRDATTPAHDGSGEWLLRLQLTASATVPPLPTQPTNGDCNLRLESHP